MQIQLSRDYSNEKFFEEIEKIKNEGCQVTTYEVNPDKYSAKFNICEGENLFEGDKEGAIISDEMHNNCKINVT